jgi:hypothetical protein
VCSREGLIGKTMFAIDGCKLAANCSKEWSGTRADFEKKKTKIEKSIRYLVKKHRDTDVRDTCPSMVEREERTVEKLKSQVEKIKKWLDENDDKMGPSGTAKKSNMTDNQSAKMPTSHGVVQGYNGIAAVDEKCQVVVHAEAFGEGQENQLLKPMLDGVREEFSVIGQRGDVLKESTVTADSGYFSEKNMEMLAKEGVDAYIPDPQFRKRDSRFATAVRHKKSIDRHHTKSTKRYFSASDFVFDESGRKLICPAGNQLYLKNSNFRVRDRRGISYMGWKTKCGTCHLRSKCLRNEHTRARQVTIFDEMSRHRHGAYTEWMINRIDTVRGRFLYSRRMGIVEPVFANIRRTLGLDRFTLRGRPKVNMQWKLFCTVHNIGKLARYGFAPA